MQSNRKKQLTIAIPTYNRPEKLQKQIRQLLPQLTEEVEVLVLDNNSPYNIHKLFTINEIEKIKIIINKVNIGMPSNYIRCLEYTETDWVWTLSDDDLILPNAIQNILSIIKKEPNAISICMNTPIDITTSNWKEFTEVMKNQQIFSMHFWMSVCVYNLSILRPYLYFGYNDLTTMIAPLIVVLKYLETNKEGRCLITSRKIIASAEEVTSWKKTEFLIRLFLMYDIFRSHSKLLKKTLFYGITKFSLYLIIKGLYDNSISKQDARYILNILYSKIGHIYILKNYTLLHIKIFILLISPIKYIKLINN